MTKTPKTDKNIHTCGECGPTVDVDFARQLEEENNNMRKAIKEAHEHIKPICLETLKQWDATKPLPDTGTIEKMALVALAKLQPFLLWS